MMEIKSTKVVVDADAKTVFDFLKNTQNFYHLMPQESISDWEADEMQCSFKVQGGIVISLIQTSFIEGEKVVLKSGEKSPFSFELSIHIFPNENKTEGYVHFEGNVNSFLKMFVEKPLTNLFNHMSAKLKEYYEKV
jgi:carbon monoxide dehydrogenase subunit G